MTHGTAPGKIILFGEHAVVYGRPAIAVPVANVSASATLRPDPTAQGLRIVAPDLGRELSLADAAADDPLAAIVRATVSHIGQAGPSGLVLNVSASIPLGRGLGSGAAISTAIVRAISQYFEHPLPPTEISTLVYQVEKLYHGTPSGIDNTVIAFEQPVFFIKGRPIQRITLARSFTLVIGDTGVVAPTHAVVGDLRRRWQENSSLYEGYFDEISAVVHQAKIMLERDIFPIEALGKLMDENHELLSNLGVSSPELDQLVAAARQAGAWGAKLSGAGWGGNIIALAGPETAAGVEQALQAAGAVGTIVTCVQ
jgi:mevalonate kinase